MGERQAQILYEFEFTSAWPTLPPPRPSSHLRTCDSGFPAQVSGLVVPSIIRANEPATTRSRSRERGQQRSCFLRVGKVVSCDCQLPPPSLSLSQSCCPILAPTKGSICIAELWSVLCSSSYSVHVQPLGQIDFYVDSFVLPQCFVCLCLCLCWCVLVCVCVCPLRSSHFPPLKWPF